MFKYIKEWKAYKLQLENIISSFILMKAKWRNTEIQKERRRLYWERKAKNDIMSLSSNYTLTDKQRSEIISFYAPYCKCGTVFHEFYYKCTGNYDPKYIPDDLYYTYIDPYFNNWEEALLIDNKTYYNVYFPDVEQPETVAKRLGGLWMDENSRLTSFETVVNRCIDSEGVFIKQATDSEGGHGVYYANNERDIKSAIGTIKGDIIIQLPLKQHSELSKLNASSVNTLRILTLLSERGVKVYSTVLRMGINGSKVDNASSGGITCGITDEGRLKNYAYSSSGEKYFRHPTSNVHFNSIIVPNYHKAIELTKTMHRKIPHFRLISWDIAIREDGEPIFIEMNIHYGELDFHQLNNGPLFGDDTIEILEQVFNKTNNR